MPRSLPSLVLLPPPPSPPTRASLSAAYRPSLTSIVSVLRGLETSTELLVVLPCPSFHGRLHLSRSEIYAEAQTILGGLYSLICVVCVDLGADVDSDGPGAIDARILLLDYDSSLTFSAVKDSPLNPPVAGPIIDLPTFSITRRRWDLIFSVDGEEGQKVLSSYMSLANRISPPVQGRLRTVSGGVSLVQKVPEPAKQLRECVSHNVVAVGGTFDHVHAGHKLLLTATAFVLQPTTGAPTTPRRLIVGITGDELLKNKKYSEYLRTWDERQQDVVNFLLSILLFTGPGSGEALETVRLDEPVPNGRAVHTKLKNSLITIECVEIQDPFGPTITDENVTALVVSGETRSGGQAVNNKRAERGWHALEVFEVDVLDAQDYDKGGTKTDDFASKISSTAIRKRKAERTQTSSL